MKKENKPSSATGEGTKFNRTTAKRKGEVAEAAFLSKAIDLGFDVAKPWGDSSQFDFIVHSGPRCWRVQVKSARHQRQRGYGVKVSGNRDSYTEGDIDFLVTYIVPENIWYVIPIGAVQGLSRLWFFPDSRRGSRFEMYREAWCLMACPGDGKCNPEISVHRSCLAGSVAGVRPLRGK